ncbi:hypothetical protein [Nostoc sp.]|uniref:hypothetical protein n=1 Tax=Nostoc sp. TaxID=1180 RepID=UPI002FFAA73B
MTLWMMLLLVSLLGVACLYCRGTSLTPNGKASFRRRETRLPCGFCVRKASRREAVQDWTHQLLIGETTPVASPYSPSFKGDAVRVQASYGRC